MVKVKNIVVTEHNFKHQFNNPDADTKQCLELVSAKELLDLLPKENSYTIRFLLTEVNSQLTNAIRRCLEDELPTLTMTFNLMHDSDGKPADFIHDLRTNDKNIFGKCDELKKRIEAIPIHQNIDPSEWKISLDINNTTSDLIDITSSHLTILHKGKKVPVDKFIYPNYILMRLYPHCQLRITNIRIVEGLGMDNANSFKRVCGVYYEDQNKPMTKVGDKYVGKSSLESNPTSFIMGYSTFRNSTNVYAPIHDACQVLTSRLQTILTEWTKIKNGESSDKIHVKKEGETYVITIENEGSTLSHLLQYYIFLELPSIAFSTAGIKHLDKIGGIVKIKNKDYINLFANAGKASIKDIQTIEAAFK